MYCCGDTLTNRQGQKEKVFEGMKKEKMDLGKDGKSDEGEISVCARMCGIGIVYRTFT